MLNDKLQPHKITDLMDNIDLYLDEMRSKKDLKEIPKILTSYSWSFFRDIDPPKEKLKTLSIFFVDHIYRYAAELTILDEYTKIYFASVFTEIFDYLQSRGIDTFYVLDNSIREDRFNLTILLYALCGFATVVPYSVKGRYLNYMTLEEQAKWALSFKQEDFDPKKITFTMDNPFSQVADIENLIEKYLSHKRNIIYIEKDDTVNYLQDIIKISKNSHYLALLRNLAPSDPRVTIL